MDGPVRPVIVAVVEQRQDQDRGRQVTPAVTIELEIPPAPTGLRRPPCESQQRRQDHDRQCRPVQFAPWLRHAWLRLDAPMSKTGLAATPDQPIAAARQAQEHRVEKYEDGKK